MRFLRNMERKTRRRNKLFKEGVEETPNIGWEKKRSKIFYGRIVGKIKMGFQEENNTKR